MVIELVMRIEYLRWTDEQIGLCIPFMDRNKEV